MKKALLPASSVLALSAGIHVSTAYGQAPPFRPDVHWLEWATASGGGVPAPGAIFDARSSIRLSSLPVGDNTFVQADFRCAPRTAPDQPHQCAVTVSDARADAVVSTQIAIAPGQTVQLGELVRRDGSRIGLFLTGGRDEGRPFDAGPRGKDVHRAHAFDIATTLVRGSARAPLGDAEYTFDREAHIDRYDFGNGAFASVEMACDDRATTSDPHKCKIVITRASGPRLETELQTAPMERVRVREAPDRDGSYVEWTFTGMGPR